MTTSRHDRVREQLEEYAVGALSPEERADVERHIQSCATCANELRALLALAEDLAHAVEPVSAPADLRRRVLAALADTPQDDVPPAPRAMAPSRRASLLQPWLLAAAAAAILALASLLYLSTQRSRELAVEVAEAQRERREMQERLDGFAGQADRAIAILTAGDMRSMQLSAPAGQSSAVARAYWSPTQGLLVAADDLPDPPPGRIYQVWIIAGAGASPVSAGLLGDDRSRRGMLLVPPPPSIGGAANVTVAVTDEPAGGRPAPSGSMRLVGSL
jgi:anti-sigma-K factor RskA